MTGIVLAALMAAGHGAVTAQPPPGVIPDQYIIVLRDNAASPQQVANEHARQHAADVSHVYEFALRGYAARIPAQRLAAVRADPRVLFISEDREVQAFAQEIPTGVNRIDGEVSSVESGDGAGQTNVAVAIIDTGIQTNHPDLRVVGGRNCVPNNGFFGRADPTRFNDGNGHGTHVAGTVGARDDSNGVVGIAPGAPLYAVRVLNNQGSGQWSWIICGVDWVTANAATIKVANMSLGGSGTDAPSDANCNNSANDALHKAICNSVKKGVTYVVAAGNSGVDFAGSVPATYDEVLTVTAVADFNGAAGGGAAATCRTDVDDTAADFSNYAVSSADAAHTIAAPGVCITSTWINGGYNTISGTSMASPHLAGVAALCLAGPCAGLSPGQIITKLRGDAVARPASYGFSNDPNSPNGTRYYGYLTYAGGY